MAKKTDYHGLSAYREGPFIVFDNSNNPIVPDFPANWVIIHEQSGLLVMGKGVRFKQKKTALAYVNGLLSGGFDWSFNDAKECTEKNDLAAMERCRNEAWLKAREVGK